MACIRLCPASGLSRYMRMGRRAVEAGQPHVADDHQAEIVRRVLEALGQALARGLGADMAAQRLRVIRAAGDDHLHRPALVVGVVPVRAQQADLLVQPRGDVAAHGHHHRLAFHRRAPLLPVLDDEGGQALEALRGADQRLQRHADALVRARAVAIGVDDVLHLVLGHPRAVLVHLELDDARLVVERPGGAVLHRLADVVDVRVVAEDMDRVLVVALQRRAGEADEGRVRQGLAHPARAALDEAVLAAVRLVRHDHDVGPLRDHPLGLGELLDGREHHAARGAVQQLPQVVAALRPAPGPAAAARGRPRRCRRAGRPGRCGR